MRFLVALLLCITWEARAADTKISALNALTNAGVATDDLLAIVDTSGTETKKIAISELDTRWDQSAKIANVVEDTSPQLGGALDVNSQSIVSVSNGAITLAPHGTGAVVVSGAALTVAERIKGNDTATISASEIDWAVGNYFKKTLGANTTFTFANLPTNGGQTITVKLTQDSSTRTVTWPTLKWEGGTLPVMSTASGAIDVCTFIAFSSTDVYGSCIQDMQ